MAVAFDAFTANANQTGDHNFTHTPVGTPKAVIVWVVEQTTTADHIAGITYGGVSMTEVSGSPNILSSGETGAVYCYFLGSSIPTGAQSVSVDTTATSNYITYCVTLTAATSATQVKDSDGTINSTSQANPSVTLSLGGLTSFAALALHSGQQAVTGITPLTSWTSRSETDRGAQQAACYTFNTIGTSDVTAGWTQTADDACAVCIAVTELNLFERSISESISISPAVARLKTANRSISQSISISPAVAEVALHLRDIAQSITISAAIAASKILPRAISQSITIVDSISRLLTANRSIDQSISISPAVAEAALKFRTMVDSITISAAINTTKVFTRVINEAISIVDSLTKVATYNRAIAQAISIIDSVTKVSLYLRTVTQNISIVDSLNRIATKLRTINQSIGISDLVERVFISGGGQLFTRTINETITIADAVNRTFIQGVAQVIKMIGGAGGRRLKRWNFGINRIQRFRRWFPR